MPKVWISYQPYPRQKSNAFTQKEYVVVLDILRATTSMVAALRAGCKRIIPCRTIREARREAGILTQQGESVFLAGERKGLPIAGFAAGNTPMEFEKTRGKTVVLTTTNGTRALAYAVGARQVIIACLNNRAAVGNYLVRQKAGRIVILAAGDKGHEAREDTIAAGQLIHWLVNRLKQERKCIYLDSNAMHAWFLMKMTDDNVENFLLRTSHGKFLKKIGCQKDIHYSAQMDTTRKIGYLTLSGIKSF